jgi:hypothetical protein
MWHKHDWATRVVWEEVYWVEEAVGDGPYGAVYGGGATWQVKRTGASLECLKCGKEKYIQHKVHYDAFEKELNS